MRRTINSGKVRLKLNYILFCICFSFFSSCNFEASKVKSNSPGTPSGNDSKEFYSRFSLQFEENLRSEGFSQEQSLAILSNSNLVSSSMMLTTTRIFHSLSSELGPLDSIVMGNIARGAVETLGNEQSFGQTSQDKTSNLAKITKALNSALKETLPSETSKNLKIDIMKEVSRTIFETAIDDVSIDDFSAVSEIVVSRAIENLINKKDPLNEIKNISSQMSESILSAVPDRDLTRDDDKCSAIKGVTRGPIKAFEALQLIEAHKLAMATSEGINKAISVVGDNISLLNTNNCIQDIMDDSFSRIHESDAAQDSKKAEIISEIAKGAVLGASDIKGSNAEDMINVAEIVAVSATERVSGIVRSDQLEVAVSNIAENIADGLAGSGLTEDDLNKSKEVLRSSIGEIVTMVTKTPFDSSSMLTNYIPICQNCELPRIPKFSFENSILVEMDKFLSSVSPLVTEGGIKSCEVSPSLPIGLNLSNDCKISGTPEASAESTEYKITGENAGGTFSANVSIGVQQVNEPFSQISSGISFTCGITSLKKLKCWGSNSYGTLGVGHKSDTSEIVYVDKSTDFKNVQVAYLSACALTLNNKLKCWGNNIFGTLGNASLEEALIPVFIDYETDYIFLASERGQFCGITTSGALKCWGFNYFGELGVGHTSMVYEPTTVDPGVGYKVVALNYNRICGITIDDRLKCWGANYYGSVGDGTTINRTTPILIDDGVGYREIALGSEFTCGITLSNQRKCWGANASGTWFGNNEDTTSYHYSPIVVEEATEFKKISLGLTHGCGIKINNQLKCWGDNAFGALGDGTILARSTPVLTDNGVRYQSVSAGEYYTCGINLYGRVKCWGRNIEGQLGRGSYSIVKTPTLSVSENKFKKLALGSFHSCAIDLNSKVFCWGTNSHGQVGYGSDEMFSYPKPINDLSSFINLTAGRTNTCGLTNGKSVKCWGFNGLNDMTFGGFSAGSSLSPMKLFSDKFFKDLATSDGHRCALDDDGHVYCWGDSSSGQVGNGTASYQSTPVLIDIGIKYKKIKAGSFYSCGITLEDSLRCWGNIIQEDFSNKGLNSLIPVNVMPGIKVLDVSVANGTLCAIDLTGSLLCIGKIDNTFTEVPMNIDATEKYTQISGSQTSYCGVTSLKRVKCWGSNWSGQLGNGNQEDIQIPGFTNDSSQYLEVGMGELHACGITIDGSLKCWGRNSEGQLGISLKSEFSPQNINN